MKKVILLFIGIGTFISLHASDTDSLTIVSDSLEYEIDYAAIESSLNYQEGQIEIEDGNAVISVPIDYYFLGNEDAQYVLEDLWGNMEDDTVLGLLVPKRHGVTGNDSYVFVLSYEEIGYVDDEDALDIDYDELLAEMKTDMSESNEMRNQLGYESIALVGWAVHPHYDAERQVLHWAKEVKFGEDSLNTLNYDLRILGRKGVFVLGAVASMSSLPEVNGQIEHVLESVSFNQGSSYADFDPDLDEVAAYTVGGLVAGKVLAKVGAFALIAKFWKFILIGLAGAGAWFMKLFKSKKAKENEEKKDNQIDDSSDKKTE